MPAAHPGARPRAAPDDPEDSEEALVDMPELPEVPKLPPPPPSRMRDNTGVDRDEDTSWIEIVLVDEDEPEIGIPFARYRLELPNGKVLEGRLDDKGRAMVTGIKQGGARSPSRITTRTTCTNSASLMPAAQTCDDKEGL